MGLFLFVICAASVPFIIYVYCKYVKRRGAVANEQPPVSRKDFVPAAEEASQEDVHRSHFSLLIVEDQYPIRVLLKEALHDFPCEVLEAETGAQALELLRQCPSRLVLLDVSLPDQSGLDVLRTIRTMRPSTEVIMMSAYSDADKVNEAKAAGAIGFFSKPFDLEELRLYLSSRL
ncbi:response regulator [Paenibacillus apiarius]|uniref:Response regulator n=1 Tax=Paenibacillus apiarius TaxID=46240 RepID=A0ABT4DXR6_9BACL|nr:response regulator [Paenibacillus apiarius]MCY9515963.1 response regulator [Paenibacillus apiarius]MCY9520873.1 response regulator [Paenibacillus apiarius]MCY9553578.1 response regulator [Paenibacillus apiarius]MCY9557899.1 response regulator [Paenibacillus apiarius]MCY9685754.1 response regulator [Paenibacillus apiarius]